MVKRVKRWYKRSSRRRPVKGFTLMEVLVTVLIIGVLAAISYPVYKKSVTKARAAEAVNLIQLVKNKQILTYANSGKYFSDFGKVGRITQGTEEAQGAQLTVNRDYTVYLNNAQTCVTAYYKKDTPAEFSFSSGYENDGLGCSGGVCNSYGNILGDTKSVCNCGTKTCGNGYTLNQDTCSCECLLGCENGGSCYAPYGGGQSRPCASGCGTEHSSSTCGGPSWSGSCSSPTQTQATSQACPEGCGTMHRSCSATCGGGSCGEWNKSECKAPSQNQATSQSCGRANSGSQTRTCSETCDGGSCSEWSACTGQTCDESVKLAELETCGEYGTHTRTATCNSNTGSWYYSAWSECECDSGYHMEGEICQPDWIDCEESSKPSESQSCGNCNKGTQTREVTCDGKGNWTNGDWSECVGGGECASGETSYCSNGSKTCDDNCTWSDCVCKSGYIMTNGSCQPDCSIASVKNANKAYCCRSAQERDKVCYIENYKWFTPEGYGGGGYFCAYPDDAWNCSTYNYPGYQELAGCNSNCVNWVNSFKENENSYCQGGPGSNATERDYRNYGCFELMPGEYNCKGAPCNAAVVTSWEYLHWYGKEMPRIVKIYPCYVKKEIIRNGW